MRLFSPWRYNIDAAAGAKLAAAGWRSPDLDRLSTGADIVRDYLQPLAALPAIAAVLHTNAHVEATTRLDRSKLGSDGRDDRSLNRSLTRAVIDASGTWSRPNPIGLDGLPVKGEVENADRISYGIPDVTGAAKDDFVGKHTLVIGAGHSAINVALDLMDLQREVPATRITWATQAGGISRLLGGGLNDELPGRGQLGLAAARAIASGKLRLVSPFALRQITRTSEGLVINAELDGKACGFDVDRIVVATGFRPDLDPLRELRLALDPVVEAPVALAPLIDPNLHSCGTVPPHGVVELVHPEKDFYIVGMKSYGRAPTFLMPTGYEQVRSIAAELADDAKVAREVHLVLPETGVCSATPALAQSAGCCGGPAPQGTDACCVQDAQAKASGCADCGCSAARPKASACCAVLA